MSTETKTSLTNNCQAIATMDNGKATVVFQDTTTGRPLWTANVSYGTKPAKLDKDTGTATLTLVAGLTVTYSAVTNGQYYVILDGQIIDTGVTTTFSGESLGNYVPSDSKVAVTS